MDKKQTPHRRKPNPHTIRTGVNRPSDAVSGGKFIQYPSAQDVSTVEAGHRAKGKSKKLKNPQADSSRRSRKDIRKQKNRNRFVTFILVTILLAICLFISLKVLFIVRNVESVGSERYSSEELVAFCAIPMEENIFKIDTETLETALVENFTYVEKADVQRKLPDKILIEITDSVPTYYNENMEGELSTYIIYSQNFKKLTVQAAVPEGLMGIEADLSNEEHRETLVKILDILARKGYEDITCVMVGESGEISLVYDDRVTVKLGTMLDMEYKLKMSFHVLTNELGNEEKGVIDSTQAGSAVFKAEY